METSDNELYNEVIKVDRLINRDTIQHNSNNHKYVDKIWEVYSNLEKDKCINTGKHNY